MKTRSGSAPWSASAVKTMQPKSKRRMSDFVVIEIELILESSPFGT
jgi:hypothetical protein